MNQISMDDTGLTLNRDNETWEQVVVTETNQVMWLVSTPCTTTELVSKETLQATKSRYQQQVLQLTEQINSLNEKINAVDTALAKIDELTQSQD